MSIGMSRVCGGTGDSNLTNERIGAIPACAGEPSPPLAMAALLVGLSPRVRGNRVCSPPSSARRKAIPACAGEPSLTSSSAIRARGYPRVCGGTRAGTERSGGAYGLSPRVRGNPGVRNPSRRCLRAIPACAGEPVPHTGNYPGGWGYPRVCGGTRCICPECGGNKGLSPRVRGNRRPTAGAVGWGWAIPACAGEPGPRSRVLDNPQGYPRVCGGTGFAPPPLPGSSWLSPRVRGNRPTATSASYCPLAIPACAGEPVSASLNGGNGVGYPRVCGGTGVVGQTGATIEGLSPRVRGNLISVSFPFPAPRAIPACAGEPQQCRDYLAAIVGYPRVCGGT